jgi:uncharacterized membrane protein YsdA (DUF1294 family)
MSRTSTTTIQPAPIYSRWWQRFKQFPSGLHRGANRSPSTSGTAAAALFSGGIGAIAMMLTHHYTELSKANDRFLTQLVSAIPLVTSKDPMWGNLGGFAGKEIMLLVGWLASWTILHHLLKHRQVKPRTLIFGLLSLFTIATAMTWHPLFPYLSLQ